MSEAGGSKGKAVGKGCLIVLGVLVALTIIGGLFGDKDPGSKSSSVAETAASEPALKVTAKEVSAAYEANEAAAQQKYGNRTLEVTATIQDIQLGLGDVPFLVLEGTNQFMGPHAQLDEESQKFAPQLVKNTEVTLTCQKVSEVIGNAMFDDCHIH